MYPEYCGHLLFDAFYQVFLFERILTIDKSPLLSKLRIYNNLSAPETLKENFSGNTIVKMRGLSSLDTTMYLENMPSSLSSLRLSRCLSVTDFALFTSIATLSPIMKSTSFFPSLVTVVS